MAFVISPRIRKKLAEKHNVSEDEIRQCFTNVEGTYIRDTREEHRTDPASHWFVAETNQRRVPKVVFLARKIETPDGPKVQIEIKTAYEANSAEISIYDRIGKGR